MKTIFVLDGNFYLHRIFYATKMRNPTSEQLCNTILGSITKDAIAVKADQILVVFDGSAVFRYDIYPDYKGQRKDNKKKDEIYSHLKQLKRTLKIAGIQYVQKKKLEGDDVIASFVAQNKEKYKIVIGTRDKDMNQCLQTNVTIYDGVYKKKGMVGRGRIISRESLCKDTGLLPAQFLEQQILAGDSVDNIKRLMTAGKAKKGILTYGSIKKWAQQDRTFRRLLKANLEHFKLNKQLVTLRKDATVELEKFVPNHEITSPSYRKWVLSLKESK